MLYSKPYALRVITPTRTLFEGEVVGARLPGALAPFEVLARHAPLISALEAGEIRLTEAGDEGLTYRYLATSGGVVEVRREDTILLAETAEWAEEIDRERASAARERALQRLRHPTPDIDLARAEAALQRALTRLHVASRAQ